MVKRKPPKTGQQRPRTSLSGNSRWLPGIKVSAEMLAEAQARAAADGVTFSELVRQGIALRLASGSPKKLPATPRRRAVPAPPVPVGWLAVTAPRR